MESWNGLRVRIGPVSFIQSLAVIDAAFSYAEHVVSLYPKRSAVTSFEFDSDIFAGIDVGSWRVMSLKKWLGLSASVTYVHSAEAAPTDPPLQPIFTGDT